MQRSILFPFICLLAFLVPAPPAAAQFGGLLDRLKKTAEQEVEQIKQETVNQAEEAEKKVIHETEETLDEVIDQPANVLTNQLPGVKGSPPPATSPAGGAAPPTAAAVEPSPDAPFWNPHFPALLAGLKFAPQTLTEDKLLQVTQRQVRHDQQALQEIAKQERSLKTYQQALATQAPESEKKKYRHNIQRCHDEIARARRGMFFTAAQVTGREPQFVANELQGELRSRLLQAAQAAPLKLYAEWTWRLGALQYDHNQAVLHLRQAPPVDGQRPLMPLGSFGGYQPAGTDPAYIVYRFKSTPHPQDPRPDPLVTGTTWAGLRKDMPRYAFWTGASSHGIGEIGLREKLAIPPLHLSAAQAEQILKPLDHNTAQALIAQGVNYEPNLRVRMDVTVTGLVKPEWGAPLAARLDALRVIGPRGETLLNVPVETLATTADDVAAAQAAAAQATQADQARRTVQQGWDIVGLKPGMAFAAAEALVRNRQPGGLVIDSQKPGNRLNEGYGWSRLFVSADGQEVIGLLGDPARTDELLGVYRRIDSGEMNYQEQQAHVKKLLANLEQKYGANPARSLNRYIWGQDPGNEQCAWFHERRAPISAADQQRLREAGLDAQRLFDKAAIALQPNLPVTATAPNHPGAAAGWSGCAPVLAAYPGNISHFWLFQHARAVPVAVRALQDHGGALEKQSADSADFDL